MLNTKAPFHLEPRPQGHYRPHYSMLHLEAALCVWEELCEARRDERLSEDLKALWEARGTVRMRLEVTPAIASYALAVWDSPGVEEAWSGMAAYDWEFIPFVMRIVKLHPDTGKLLFPDVRRVARESVLDVMAFASPS